MIAGLLIVLSVILGALKLASVLTLTWTQVFIPALLALIIWIIALISVAIFVGITLLFARRAGRKFRI